MQRLPLYNTIESNKKKIQLNESLIHNRNKRKQQFLNYNKYRTGLQTDLYERLQDIDKMKKQVNPPTPIPETKAIVPYTVDDDDDEDDEYEEQKLLYEEIEKEIEKLEVFNPNVLGHVSRTSKFVARINPHTRSAEIYINKTPLTNFNPLNKTFEMNGKTFKFNKNIINLMRGAPLEGQSYHNLEVYAGILAEANAAPFRGRFKDVKDKLNDFEDFPTGEGLSATTIFLPDDPSELFNRLQILLTARKEGHNSTENEIHAILKRLLEKNLITNKQYKFFS